MGRKPGSLNKNDREKPPRYELRIKNPIEDTESKQTFLTVAEIVKFLSEKGLDIAENTVRRYVVGERPAPPFMEFIKIHHAVGK